MNHGIVLARKQRIHAQAGLKREFLEAAAVDFMGEKYRALLCRELVQGILKRLQQHRSGIGRLRSGIRRRKQVLQR